MIFKLDTKVTAMALIYNPRRKQSYIIQRSRLDSIRFTHYLEHIARLYFNIAKHNSCG